MGGLKKYMPYTYMTFLAGWLAICGIIPFSGFWSKDEILWRTASTTYIPLGWILWIVGTIAATCTAFYMTRLVAMTFWGKERFGNDHGATHANAHDDHGKGDGHGHGAHTPHESPASMWVPLAVLAILATVGGFIGISTAFTGGKHVGGKMNIVNWMDPIIWNPQTRAFGSEHVAAAGEHEAEPVAGHAEESALPSEEQEGTHAETGFNLAHSAEKSLGSHTAAEWLFILISLVVAGIGIGLGLLFYLKNPRLPDLWAARLAPLYRASLNKYWVDEFYGWAVTRRTMDAARGVFAFDSKVVDGAVNGSAWLTRLTSRLTGGTDKYFVDGMVNAVAGFVIRIMAPLVRATQTGFLQNYALVMVIGLLAAVALFFTGDIVAAVKGLGAR